jgi:peptidoglycan-associated lipoprotein
MRTLHLTFCVAILGALLLVTSGCGKSIQANSGSKSFEPGAKRNGALPPKTVASTNGSRQPAPSSPSMAAAAPTPTPEPMASEPATPIPSLSTLDSGPPPLNGRKSDEQRIPGELLVAKTEPSDTSRRQVEEIQREQLATAAAGLEDVFFGFDSWQISNEGKQTLMLDAEWIKANPAQKVTIEGHCDERGTLAYNLVLGEKRAKAVQKYLVELGIDSNRLTVVSYGKERPFCKDREEGCHQKNRRGHIAVRVQ